MSQYRIEVDRFHIGVAHLLLGLRRERRRNRAVDDRGSDAPRGEVVGIRTRDRALATGDRAVDQDQHGGIVAARR